MTVRLKKILKERKNTIALLIGNGINRYVADDSISWHNMLLKMWGNNVPNKEALRIPEGISLTEFYDALDLSGKKKKSLQNEFCELISNWKGKDHHKKIVYWAKENSIPVLTTNFDENLSSIAGLDIRHMPPSRFTDYYPWSSYFSNTVISDPSAEFAIWHINGLKRYPRSLRLGLGHYMGAVGRARKLTRKSDKSLFKKNIDIKNWAGKNTWLHVFFKNELVIFGLGLSVDEIFIRWLLIERAKFFKKFPRYKRNTYFIYAGKEVEEGQRLFFSCMNIEVIREESFDEIYNFAWT